MVDILALAVSHGLLALTVWRLLSRDDLYDDLGTSAPKTRRGVSRGNEGERNA
ncbi:hypothetical protein [Novosphingobium sp.]|uniref:hypothetical protein n=1 Tax=Novosphingobium sp. TaxID=1874826 RepID=UPI002B470870|nr:hypothetical protein [Novosphingobium sp.]HKR91233.1 hypothetical protein [Novosphingobium sp.]